MCASSTLWAENFKTNKVVKLPISSTGTQNTISFGVNESLLIELPADMSFIDGIELTFKLPSEIAQIKNSILWSFYEGLFPSPSINSIEYSGVKKASGSIGNTYSLTMKIPLKSSANIKKDSFSCLVQPIPEIVDGKIFLRLQLGFKNAEDMFSSSQIKVTGKPIFLSKGKLVISPSYPDEEEYPYTLLVDGNITKYVDTGIMLSPGIHTISFMSDYFRNEQRTISIEQAKTQTLKINFRSIVPTLRIVAPEGTKVYLDGFLFPNMNAQQDVKPGDHDIRFIFGNYELVKNITVVNGRNYTVSVNFEATITENDF